MLKDQLKKDELRTEMDANLEDWDAENSDLEQKWKILKETVYSTASNVLGKQGRKHQDWFDEHDEHLLQLIQERNKARQASLLCNTRMKRKAYSKAQGKL
jgi:hypothetical protein